MVLVFLSPLKKAEEKKTQREEKMNKAVTFG